MNDVILIRGLQVPTFIGVPDEERAEQQVLKIHLELTPDTPLSGLGDSIERTVNYYDVAQRVKQIAAERPRKLIETLAEEVLTAVLAEYPLDAVLIEIEKFILEDADWVGLRMLRKKDC